MIFFRFLGDLVKFTYLYAANESFANVVVRSRQTSHMKGLQLQSWEVMADLYRPLLKNTQWMIDFFLKTQPTCPSSSIYGVIACTW